MSARLLLGGLVLLGACSSDPAPVAPPGPSAPPSLAITSPASDTVATRGLDGGYVSIEYIADDPDSGAATTLWAEPLGAGAAVEIAADLPHGDGAALGVAWNTAGVAPGRYRIAGEIRDTDSIVGAFSAGYVNVVDPLSRSEVGSARDWATSVDTYPDGSYVVAGTFGLIYKPYSARIKKANVVFGLDEDNETLFVTGEAHAFVARYNADGTLAWARRAVGQSLDVGSKAGAVAALPDGGCLMTGSCYNATFGIGEPNEVNLKGTSLDDVFLARYAADGSLVWARLIATGSFGEWANAIAVADDGSYVIAGSFLDDIEFEDGTRLSSDGSADIFAAGFDPDGSLRWARQVAGPGGDYAYGIALRGDGSCVVSGEQYRPVAGTPLTWATTPVILSIASDGSLEWSRTPDVDVTVNACRGFGCAVLDDGSAVVVGDTNGDLVLWDGTLIEAGIGDSFVIRYDRSGRPIWGKSLDNARLRGVRARPDASLLLAGQFSGTATIGADTLTSAGEADVLVVRCDEHGSFLWARGAGGTLTDSAAGLGVFADGSSVCVGSAGSTPAFGNIYVGRLAADGTQG
ncbi:MAG: hypothetical protein ACYTGN_13005 [Planctomycetota bacterium]|jgi:hypothetical protein